MHKPTRLLPARRGTRRDLYGEPFFGQRACWRHAQGECCCQRDARKEAAHQQGFLKA
jgi:hypothetical protein